MQKTSNVAFQVLYFKRCGLKKYGKMILGKQVTLHFKRCGLKKYGKMIRGKQATLYFKRCGLKKYGKIKCFYNVIHAENK
jgi:hypothetical protein